MMERSTIELRDEIRRRQSECKATGHEPVVRSAALGEALGTWLCDCGKVRWVVEVRT